VADAVEASAAVVNFWADLAADDDALLMNVTASDTWTSFGTEAGFSDRVRGALEVTAELCGRMVVSSKVRVVEGRMIFVCIPVGEDRQPITLGTWGPEKRHLWAPWTVVERGRWTVGGTYVQSEGGWPEGTEYIDLPYAPDPSGPPH
jgi:hypothetical protein